jgi:hypothetical protein
MANNKFIFQEQQKIAIKLSKALELTLDEFRDFNKENNPVYLAALERNNFKPVLPSPD